MSEDLCRSMFSIVDAMVENAIADVKEEGAGVSCAKGCSYCCHLLVEISWEEARKIAELRGVDYEEIALGTSENVKQLFGIA